MVKELECRQSPPKTKLRETDWRGQKLAARVNFRVGVGIGVAAGERQAWIHAAPSSYLPCSFRSVTSLTYPSLHLLRLQHHRVARTAVYAVFQSSEPFAILDRSKNADKMTSRLISSSQSSPRRVTLPALPLTFSRSAATTPRNLSPIRGVDAIVKDSSEMKLKGGDESVKSAELAEGPVAKTPPSNDAQVSIIVDEAGSPTHQAIQPSAEDDVFATVNTTTETNTAVNPVAQRIMNNLRAPANYNGFAPRPDRMSQVPTAANAQGLYPPDALIFVANLSNQRSEDQLEVSCHQAFDGYGPNHVKIRRDKNHHPFAFIQFESADDANAAVSGASGLIMDGRKIRIEHAKAERAVILSKVDGSMVTEAEARGILERYGPLELIAASATPNRQNGNVTHGMFVKFAYYLDCRDALRLFNNHTSGFNLYMAPSLEPRFRTTPDGSTVVRGFAQYRSVIDQKSIYVGNLPETATRTDLEELFGGFGHILQVNVIKKIYDGDVLNIFAFVEFAHSHEADMAAASEPYLQGFKLRVEQKEYSSRRPARLVTPNVQVQPNNARTRNAHDNAGQGSLTRRAMNNNGNYNARGTNQVYTHAHPNVAVQGMHPHHVTPPATVQYTHHGMRQPTIYGTPHHQTVAAGFGIMTPPSHSGMHVNLNQMLPTGIFSPTPSHLHDVPHGYQAAAFGSTPAMNPAQAYHQTPGVYMGQPVPTIQESGEEGQY